MKKARILSLLLTVAMMLSLVVVPAAAVDDTAAKAPDTTATTPEATPAPEEAAPAAAPAFTDTVGHWAETSIARWAGYNVVQGTGEGFNPDGNMTRAQFATLLVNLMGYTEKSTETFADVKADDWFADAVSQVAAAGVMLGSNGNANPNKSISRAEAAVMLCRAMNITPTKTELTFADKDLVADWAVDAVAALSERGMIAGVGDNNFAPKNPIQRAAVAKMLDNMITSYVTEKDAVVTGEQKGLVIIAAGAAAEQVAAPKADEAKAVVTTIKDAKLAENLIIAPKAGAADVKLTGTTTATGIVVNAPNAKLNVAKTVTADSVTVMSAKNAITVDGTVTTVTANTAANDLTLVVNAGAKITDFVTAANNVTVSGKGKLTNAKILAGDKIAINTAGTAVTADKGVTNATVNGKPVTEDKPIAGGGGGATPPSIQYADVKAAKLHDVRADVADAVKNGAAVADDKLTTYYDVTGVVVDDNNVDVAVTTSHLMQHMAGNNTLGYWVGVGVVLGKTDTVAVGKGAYDAKTATFDAKADGTTGDYSNYYFNAANMTTGYIAVKTPVAGTVAENIVVYNIDMTAVERAPAIENVKVFVVKDEASYKMLPAAYLEANPYTAEIGTAIAAKPWLTVVYDSNETGKATYAVTQDGTALTATPSETVATATINKDRYQAWIIKGTDAGETEDKLSATSIFGEFALTITKGDTTVTKTVLNADPAKTYVTLTYVADGKTVATQQVGINTATPVAVTVTPIAGPAKTGYAFTEWQKDGAKWDATVLTATTVTAKYDANQYTIAYDANGGTGTTASNANVAYGADVTLTTNAFTYANHTFAGWNTKADGTGTAYADKAVVKNLATTGTATLFAQWNHPAITSVAIVGTPVVGAVLTSKVMIGETEVVTAAAEAVTYKWSYADAAATDKALAETATYTVADKDVGKTLVLTVTFAGHGDAVKSAATVAVTMPELTFVLPAGVTAVQTQTADRTYNIALSGTAATGIPEDMKILFDVAAFVDTANGYNAFAIKGLFPIGQSNVKQTNAALSLYKSAATDFPENVKVKDYTKTEIDDLCLLLQNDAATITVVLTVNGVKTTYNIANDVVIAPKTVVTPPTGGGSAPKA